MLKADNRQVSIVHIFAPVEHVYDEDSDSWCYEQVGGYIRLVFDDGVELHVDDLVMYGTLRDNRGSRPLAYSYGGVTYLTETRVDVKLQVME